LQSLTRDDGASYEEGVRSKEREKEGEGRGGEGDVHEEWSLSGGITRRNAVPVHQPGNPLLQQKHDEHLLPPQKEMSIYFRLGKSKMTAKQNI
jgi:hypothetical protein